MHARQTSIAAVILSVCLIAAAVAGTRAVAPDNQHFERTWARTDQPVANGAVSRTWMWGPEANHAAIYEDYAESSNGERLVQYFDKSRMEITDSDADASSVWYVTNGLLVVEMMDGRMQVGDSNFIDWQVADVPVAGDGDDPYGPTYATFAALRDAPPLPDGAVIIQRVDTNGVVTDDPSLARYDITTAYRVQVPNIDHQIAAPFWTFMNLNDTVYEDGDTITAPLFLNPFYATGLPITEAYWAEVKVGGNDRLVLMQCFERRCLTYTPGNPEGWQVEAGNVGLHYYTWRYGDAAEPTPSATAAATMSATASASRTPTGTAPASPTGTTSPSTTPTGTETSTATPSPTPTSTTTPAATPTSTPSPTPTTPTGPNGRVFVTDGQGEYVQVFDLLGTFLFKFGWTGSDFRGIEVDQEHGWVYVADNSDGRVHKFGVDGSHILSWGGRGQGDGQFGELEDVAVGPNGRVYVTDSYDRVQRFESDGAFIQLWGNSGDVAHQLTNPQGLTVGANGSVYVIDDGNANIKKYTPDGDWLATWGSNGAGTGEYNNPTYLTAFDQRLFVADSFNQRIVITDTNGAVEDIWPSVGPGQPRTLYGIAIAEGTTVAGVDVVYVAKATADIILALDRDTGDLLFSFGGTGTGDGLFGSPNGVTVYVE